MDSATLPLVTQRLTGHMKKREKQVYELNESLCPKLCNYATCWMCQIFVT